MAKDQFEQLVEFARGLGLAKKEADLQETVIGVEKHLKGWADDMGDDPDYYYSDGCQSQHIS
ncbi:hypothetical protein DSM107010_19790 [Chroococcidiopsis cubana SAG 39.79]|uniref:Nif11 domain-containing protein n=2 Tax=Chroococcidiopsis TaxID=54298 RepID=A0AB37UN33_9CYAN|nr:hypothetical protein C7B79_02745 [Chroococcidiopsis cubana CCALA 043]RUT12849.1 hypothetical protein DSM107010_19790 [Chroococcidiopsis cubana SAG 39.79]